MKKSKILIIFFCLLMAFLTWIQADNNQNEDISKQIKELHKNIGKLEKRIKTLEIQLQKLAYSRIEIPQTFPKLRKIPRGWKEFEFEGLKYYLIPLKSDSMKTAHQNK